MKKFSFFLATILSTTLLSPAVRAEERTPFEKRAIHRGEYADVDLGLRLDDGTGTTGGKGVQLGLSGETSVAPFIRQKFEGTIGGETNDHFVYSGGVQNFSNEDVGYIVDANIKQDTLKMKSALGLGVRFRNDSGTIHGNTALLADVLNYRDDLQTGLKGASFGGARVLTEQNISDVLSIQASLGATAVYGLKKKKSYDALTSTMTGTEAKQGDTAWEFTAALAAKARLGEHGYIKAQGEISKLDYSFTEKDTDGNDLPSQDANSLVKTVVVSAGWAF